MDHRGDIAADLVHSSTGGSGVGSSVGGDRSRWFPIVGHGSGSVSVSVSKEGTFRRGGFVCQFQCLFCSVCWFVYYISIYLPWLFYFLSCFCSVFVFLGFSCKWSRSCVVPIMWYYGRGMDILWIIDYYGLWMPDSVFPDCTN